MTRNRTLSLAIAAVLVALAAGWILGRGTRDDVPATSAPQAERKVLYYRNPMGLADTSPVAGLRVWKVSALSTCWPLMRCLIIVTSKAKI